ncbi:hypothetical protein [Corallococcus sp. EGB]|uniref:hypothetical protein n=1 Tax=Corallococcus sp. EGB TaxID=1521117 RepID=UPI001CBC785A|nr:hypothetical protein [Corallococcus sp. EGB]
MKKTLKSLLVALLCWSLPAFASPYPPLTPTTEIPGLPQLTARITYNNARSVLNNLVRAFGQRVGLKPGQSLTEADVECAMAKLAAGFIQSLVLDPLPEMSADDVKGARDALAHYRAREEQWCRPPPGGPNKGAELVKLFIIRNTEGTSQARALTETYSSRAAQLKAPNITAGDVALAVAVAIAILAKEAVPLPIP